MTEEEMLAALEKIGEELAAKFVKKYSVSRLEQIMAHLDTVKMLVTHIHDESVREEDPARKSGVVQRMVLDSQGSINLNDAQAAVEAGER